MSDTAVRIHLERLTAMEYVRPVAGRNGQRFEYELLFDGALERSQPQMIGLTDVDALRAAPALQAADVRCAAPVDTIGTSQGETPDLAPTLQAACTPLAPALQGALLVENSKDGSDLSDPSHVGPGSALPGGAALDRRSRSEDRAPAPLSSSLAAVFSSPASGR